MKTVKSLQTGVATHFQGTPLFPMRTEFLASSQNFHSIDADAQCKRTLWSQCNLHEYCIIRTHFYNVFTLEDAKTETDKNGLYGIAWTCWYCPETDANFHWVLHTFYQYLSVSVLGSVNEPLWSACLIMYSRPSLVSYWLWKNVNSWELKKKLRFYFFKRLREPGKILTFLR